jgi:hypothetical protein
LTGEEIRPCWEAADATGATIPALPGVGAVWPLESDEDRTAVRRLDFVEVPPGPPPAGPAGAFDATAHTATTDPAAESANLTPNAASEPRWSLWGEPEA